MSMTPEEFRRYTDEEYEKKMEQKEVPYGEMVDFLESHGWEQIDYENDEWQGMFWRRVGSDSGGMSIKPAYALALLDDPQEEDKGLIQHCKNRESGDYSKVFLCNKCGKDIRKGDDNYEDGSKFYWGYYGQELEYSGGYASDPLVDTMIYRFILCESCIHQLMLTFKMPPKINTYMP